MNDPLQSMEILDRPSLPPQVRSTSRAACVKRRPGKDDRPPHLAGVELARRLRDSVFRP